MHASATWSASSRVGARTSACGLFTAGSMSERIGRAKAAVLPVPVCASPTTSRPAITIGMMAAWIAEGTSYPTSLTAWATAGASPMSANVIASPSPASASGARSTDSPLRGVRWSACSTAGASGTGVSSADASGTGVSSAGDSCSDASSAGTSGADASSAGASAAASASGGTRSSAVSAVGSVVSGVLAAVSTSSPAVAVRSSLSLLMR